jgi:hypothetical protein
MAFLLYKLNFYMYEICVIVIAEGGLRICGFAICEQKENLRSQPLFSEMYIISVSYTLNADELFLSHLTKEFIFLYLRENIDI